MDKLHQEESIQGAFVRLDEAWSQLMRQIMAEMKAKYRLSISSGQAYLLRLLDRQGPLRMSDLAGHLIVSGSGCTAIVDRALEAGWVERQRDPNDRRVVQVAISLEGKRLLDEMKQVRAQILARYLNRLTPDQVEMLVTLFSEITQTVTETTNQRSRMLAVEREV